MTRYRSVTGEVVDAIQVVPGLPRSVINDLVGYPGRCAPYYWLWDWVIRHPSGSITVCEPQHFEILYEPKEDS